MDIGIAIGILGLFGISFIQLFKWAKKWFYKPDMAQIVEKISVGLFNDAIQACDDEYPKINNKIRKATILSNKGLVFNKQAKQKNISEVDYDLNYYNKALVEYIKALRLLLPQEGRKSHFISSRKRYCILTIICDMVDIYISIFELKGQKEILTEANKLIEEYDIYKNKSTALHLNGMILIHKARLHRKMYIMEKDIKHIEMAIEKYKNAINILEPYKRIPENRLPYYLAHQNISNAQHDLAQLKNDLELLFEAEKNQQIAKDYFTIREFPEDHARSCMNLANIYVNLSDFENFQGKKGVYLENALTLFKVAEEIYDTLGIRYASYSVKRNISNYYKRMYDIKNDPTSILISFQYLEECQEICMQINNIESLCETITLKIIVGSLCIKYNPNIAKDLFDLYNKLLHYSQDKKIDDEETLLRLLCECAFTIFLNFDDVILLDKAKQLYVIYKSRKDSFHLDSYIYNFNLILELYNNGVDSAKKEIDKQLGLFENMDSIDDPLSEKGRSFFSLLDNIRTMAIHINNLDENESELERINHKLEEIAKKVFGFEQVKFGLDEDILHTLIENNIDVNRPIRIKEIPQEILENISNSVYLEQMPVQEVRVSSIEEFVKALGSNSKIILEPGEYNLSNIEQADNSDNTVVWESVYDGKGLIIQNVRNLIIEGVDTESTRLIATPRYAEIMSFRNCRNITMNNITAGHVPMDYKCNAGVLLFDGCLNINISNAELYGCGSVGLTINNTWNLKCDNVNINHCSLRALDINKSKDISFSNTIIQNHEAYSNIVFVADTKNITFENCDMSNNNNFSWSFFELGKESNLVIDNCNITNNSQKYDPDFGDAYFFKVVDVVFGGSSSILVKNSAISGNSCNFMTDNKDSVTFENCTNDNNIWN